MKIIILVAPSGAGKSTWCLNYMKENPNTLRSNRDSLRESITGTLQGFYELGDRESREAIVSRLEALIMANAVLYKKDLIVDNTSLSQSIIEGILANMVVLTIDFEVELKLFDCDLREAKSRVAIRDFGYKGLPDYSNNIDGLKYIDRQFKQYQQIKKDFPGLIQKHKHLKITYDTIQST